MLSAWRRGEGDCRRRSKGPPKSAGELRARGASPSPNLMGSRANLLLPEENLCTVNARNNKGKSAVLETTGAAA